MDKDEMLEEVKRLKNKLEEKRLMNEEMLLAEMAVHCDKNDHNGMEIVVGGTPWWERNKGGSGSPKEHNPPHAHILWKENGKFVCSRFQIESPNPPNTPNDLKTVNKTDIPLDSVAKKLIKWAKDKPLRFNEETNWEAMRHSWIQIQDHVNEGLQHPVILQTLEDYKKEKQNSK